MSLQFTDRVFGIHGPLAQEYVALLLMKLVYKQLSRQFIYIHSVYLCIHSITCIIGKQVNSFTS